MDSQREEDWIALVIDKALNPDGAFGNQCVDTVDHFGEWLFGVPWPICVGGVAGARQLLDVAPDKYWQRIDYYNGFIPQRFDVLVYAGDSLNEWGHTAVTEYADAFGINVIQQDGFAKPWQIYNGQYYSAKPAHRYRLGYSQPGTGRLLGVLRPRPEMILPGGALGAAGTITPTTPQEDTLSAAEVKEIKDHINAVLLGEFDWEGQLNRPGLNKVLIETQKRVTSTLDEVRAHRGEDRAAFAALPTRVWWGTTVIRDGKEIAVIQDIATSGTITRGDSEVLVEISESVSPEALAALVPEASAEAFIDALRARLAKPEDDGKEGN